MEASAQLAVADVRTAVAAVAEAARSAELPDVLDHADSLGAPDLVRELVFERRRTGREHGEARGFSYPKPSGSVRLLTSLDGLAQVDLHLRMGNVAIGIERSMSSRVHHYRADGAGASWRIRPWRAAYAGYRQALADARAASGVTAVVSLDVESHYATVLIDTLRRSLNSCGIDDASVGPLIDWLFRLHQIPRVPPGLPVAIANVGPLGTVALLHVDRRLDRAGVTFHRWMDDYRVFLTGDDSPSGIISEVIDQLKLGGQRLNDSKTLIADVDSPDPEASLTSGAGRGRKEPPPEPLAHLGAVGEAAGVTRSLGLLRHLGDPSGVAVLIDHPWLLDRFPKESAAYIRSVEHQVGEANWEGLEALLDRPTTVATSPAQLHLSRVLPPDRLSARDSEILFERAAGISTPDFGPAKAHLLRRACGGRGKPGRRRRRALELARETVDLDVKRALIFACRDGGLDRTARAALDHLQRHDNELRPAVRWVTR